jgi:mannitol-1-phosphate 5-dehydrogenase
MTVCVGAAGLNSVLSLIAQGLIRRDMLANSNPVDIIIAENLRNAAQYFESELRKLLLAGYPFERNVGLIETSIGKMVPIMHKKDIEEDMLQIFAEPYNTLILDVIAFKNPIPEIYGLAPKNNMKAWVDCKLFIHNLGHASSAYLGHLYNRNFIYIYEALSVSEIYNQVRQTMIQSSRILLKKYPDDFTETFLIGHVDDLLFRFRNKALGDTIFRVGCDLFRKLGPEDRLAGCIKMALELDMPYEKILFALICACRFRATDEEGALLPADYEFVSSFDGSIERVLSEVCDFDPVKEIKVFIEAREMETAAAEFL